MTDTAPTGTGEKGYDMTALPTTSRDDEYRDKLRELFASGLPDDTVQPVKKQIDNLICDLSDRVEWWIKDELSEQFMCYVQEMTDRAVEAMLAGNEAMLRRYLSCDKYGYTGRDRQHSVIHGNLFETGGIEARKRIVDAYPDLLKDERVLDLEAQVGSLVVQLNEAHAAAEVLRDRLRDAGAW